MNYSLQVGVKVLLRNSSGEFLILRRSPKKYKDIKGCWDIPGGRIVPGTKLIENLKREVLEETTMKIKDNSLKILEVQDIFYGVDKHVVRVTFEGQAVGDPVLSEEHIEFKWVTNEEALKIKDLDGYLKEIIEKKI